MNNTKRKLLFKDKDLLIFSIFSIAFAVIMEYLAYQQYYSELKSLSLLTCIGGVGFIFVAIYSLLKLKELRQRHNKEIDRANRYDTLTGIPNIYSFLDEINNKIEYIKKSEYNETLYFLNIGINRFKFVNETFGYNYADQIIIKIKKEIEKNITNNDYLGKLNGDEFGILTTCNKNELINLINKLDKIFNKEYQSSIEDSGVFISARIGITTYDKSNPQDEPQQIIKKSSIALEYAKKESMFYKIYDKTLEREANKIMKLERDLRKAIEKNEIDVFFQPKVSLKDGSIIGAEALARWYSKERNEYVRPDIFIKMAEEINMIESIGQHIFKQSAIELKKWHNLGFTNLKVAVNVSTHQFNKELPIEIDKIIKELKLKPEDLELEVTESAIISDKHSGTNLLRKVQETGITIAIDDFGTGYSSLAYLVEFPLDIIKIDKSFIDKLNDPDPKMIEKGQSVISTIIHLSHSLGCKVVAEGVEDENQKNFLKTKNCDYIQGYYYSKPLNKKDFIEYLNKKNK